MSEAAPQGPYGPSNPPPPPSGPPPRKRGHQMQPPSPHAQGAKGPGRAFVHKKLNSRQRKKFHETQAKVNDSPGRARSRSPTQYSQASYRQRSPRRYGSERGRSLSRSTRREGLRDARQYTPDQMLDETYERLSPPGSQSRYTAEQTELQRTNRVWPDDKPSFSGRQSDTYRPERVEVQAPAPAWNGDVNQFGPALASGRYKAAYRVEDEVDWADDDAFAAPVPAHTSGPPKDRAFKHRQAPYDSGGPRDFMPRGGPRHPAKFRRGQQQDWRTASWEENKGWDQPLQDWPVNNTEDQIPRAAFKKRNSGKQAIPSPMPAPQRQYVPDEGTLQTSVSQQSFSEDHAIHSAAPTPLDVPETVFDLRKYDAHVTKLYKKLPKSQSYRFHNGKTAPYQYGSTLDHDLGLCYVTFCTAGWCEMGTKCAWRHHPLTRVEREWIAQLGNGPTAKAFLEALPRKWAVPEVPLPGANMEEKRLL